MNWWLTYISASICPLISKASNDLTMTSSSSVPEIQIVCQQALIYINKILRSSEVSLPKIVRPSLQSFVSGEFEGEGSFLQQTPKRKQRRTNLGHFSGCYCLLQQIRSKLTQIIMISAIIDIQKPTEGNHIWRPYWMWKLPPDIFSAKSVTIWVKLIGPGASPTYKEGNSWQNCTVFKENPPCCWPRHRWLAVQFPAVSFIKNVISLPL